MTDLLFGWLLRSRCELRVLDTLMMIAEVFAAFVLAALLYERAERKRKEGKP